MRSFAQNDRIFAARLAFCCAVGIDRSLAIAIGFRSRVRIAEQINRRHPSFTKSVQDHPALRHQIGQKVRREILLQNSQQFGQHAKITAKSLQSQFGQKCDIKKAGNT
ncbi:hypothetical protein CA85_46610 [Allorhodopirellula solitaria]|uniref:Uncharacterized protein n=1 Tax=Allorhodopirellula solitaria TaxID=2527987 RepID=A0A5C5X1D4_9BACT|nr:hypothetical protein CA85_46610 [Allorhodopirellula solitaria]